MSLIDRIFRRPAPERRDRAFSSLSRSLGELYGGVSDGTGPVSPARAAALATVVGCEQLTSGTISTFPLALVQDMPDGSTTPAPRSAPGWRLLSRMSARMSTPATVAWMVREALRAGNALLWVQTDDQGAPAALVPVPWRLVTPRIIGIDGASPRLAFDVQNRSAEARLASLPARLFEEEVIHLKLNSEDGIVGRSVLAAGAAIHEGLQIQTAASAVWRNGMRPSLVMTAPEYLNQTQQTRATEHMEQYTSAINSGKVPLLQGGWQLKPISTTSVDAEMLATRLYNVEEICRLYNVPSVLLATGQRGSVADLAPFLSALCQQCLLPITALICAEFDTILPAGQHLQMDSDQLSRGSFSATVAALAALKQSAIITSDDARLELGWGKIEGGDQLGASPAPNWPADGKGMPALHPSPGKTGSGVAEPGSHHNSGMNGSTPPAGHA